MATEFKILRGNKENLVDEQGNSRLPAEKLVNGYWYLTNDTAEVYVCLEIEGRLQLKKINECDINTDLPDLESFEDRLTALEADHTHVFGYRKSFPTEGQVNHIYIAEDLKRSYVYHNNQYQLIGDTLYEYWDLDGDNEPDLRVINGGSAE